MVEMFQIPATKIASDSEVQALKQYQNKFKCVVMGGTGAVGRHLVARLLATGAFSKVVMLTRKPADSVQYDGDNKQALQVCQYDFESPSADQIEYLKDSDCFFITHGTTRAQADSAEAFVKIDKDYVVNTAKLWKEQNSDKQQRQLKCFLLTSTGANPQSAFLYPKTKGEIEQELAKLNFANLSIFRPGFLEGRPDDGRVMEKIGGALIVPLLKVFAPKKGCVSVEGVADAMVKASLDQQPQALKDVESYTQSMNQKIVHNATSDGSIDIYDNESIYVLSNSQFE
ncbi:hypothetical protein MP228_010556 [Amoeboaphelidium protococcarum]|nr:hypothetical protein MP228_010556 [Amoeboaphelidium protococcarum]